SAIGSVIVLNLLYQLLFVTPVMSPSSASLRKHRRQSPNFRMYARGRPHRWQRLRSRTLNFGVLASFAILAVVAMVSFFSLGSRGPSPARSHSAARLRRASVRRLARAAGAFL